ncbi:MAG: 3-deoxy-8-phosphooctulonate synthase [Gemmatimonadales bacterium]
MTTWRFRPGPGPCLIAGPCVVEADDVLFAVADRLAEIGGRFGMPVCFKASFDKANRSRAGAGRGPGLDAGLEALRRVKVRSGLPVLTDVHDPAQAAVAAEVVDVLQVPAFLCRQTDLLVACGATGKPVNVKKGQWMDPAAMAGAVEKVQVGGSPEVAVTERGTFFGYGDLVVDMRSFDRVRAAAGVPVLFDATHSVQRPGRGGGGASGGDRAAIPGLLAAAAAAGADGFFVETHPEPARAVSDAETQWPLADLESLIARAVSVWQAAQAA